MERRPVTLAAQMIGHPAPAATGQPAVLGTGFVVRAGVARAALTATAQGVYQVELNGRDVDDHLFKPGWTAYRHRLRAQRREVARLLVTGENTVRIRLAGGWYTEDFGHLDDIGHRYATQPGAALELRIEYEDGSIQQVATDASWRCLTNPALLGSGLYAGETYDARQRGLPPVWGPVAARPMTVLPLADDDPVPVRRQEPLALVEHHVTDRGTLLLDFGQNIAGRLRLTVAGEAGTVLTIRHAEVLEGDELALRPLRRAASTDRYVLAGRPDGETWEPEFTYHGFRYAEIDGWPGDFDPRAVQAIPVQSEMARTGWFESSHEQLNRLHSNIVWSMRSNFVSIPTDCPQRDERLGWTGDIAVFAPTAAFLYDCRSFLESWLVDLALEQGDRCGIVPPTVPDPIQDIATPLAGWGDAAVLVPWTLYQRYGDVAVLRAQFDSMKSWVRAVERASTGGVWAGGFQFGDWLDPTAPPDDPARGRTDPDLISTLCAFRSASILQAAADVLGDAQESEHAAAAGRRFAEGFRTFARPDGRLSSDSPTAYAAAIVYGIGDDSQVQRWGGRLAHLVEHDGYRISTGFLGTPIICDALADSGHADTAVRLLFQTESPSWLHPLSLGATTMWERWDSLLPDGSVNPGEMTSFNHYALGAIADFIHRRIGGLAPLDPGYRRVLIAPILPPQLDWAHTCHQSVHGLIDVRWERNGSDVEIATTLPAGVAGRLVVTPGADAISVPAGCWTTTLPIDGAS